MAEGPFGSAGAARGFLGVGIVFALGVVFGAALAVVVLHFAPGGPRFGPGPPFPGGGHGGPMEHMVRELDLDPQQEEQIRAIIERSQGEVHAVLERTHEQIRPLLRPEQQEKFDRFHPPALPRVH
ncbi:MAG TPA: hypothetical protein VJS92_03355 [Candidatus Polarisedimenticolaceae bacterium]|nr:hypothetical protein [Candidatus Polarisedimenticolaceae bacterium]